MSQQVEKDMDKERKAGVQRERGLLPDSLNKLRVILSSKYNPPEQPSSETLSPARPW